jgi:hypothetical protein
MLAAGLGLNRNDVAAKANPPVFFHLDQPAPLPGPHVPADNAFVQFEISGAVYLPEFTAAIVDAVRL